MSEGRENVCHYCDHSKYQNGKIIDPSTDLNAIQMKNGSWKCGVCVLDQPVCPPRCGGKTPPPVNDPHVFPDDSIEYPVEEPEPGPIEEIPEVPEEGGEDNDSGNGDNSQPDPQPEPDPPEDNEGSDTDTG